MENVAGLGHEQCLKLMHDQIDEVLAEFKFKNFKLGSLIKSFLRDEKIKFVHNLMPVFLCSFGLLISFHERYKHLVCLKQKFN